MTKIQALNIAMEAIKHPLAQKVNSVTNDDAINVLEKMIEQLEKGAENRVEKRNAFVAEIMPKLFAVMGTDEKSAQTAGAIFDSVKSELPKDVTVGKVRAMLLRSAEVAVIDNGRNPKTYFHKVA